MKMYHILSKKGNTITIHSKIRNNENCALGEKGVWHHIVQLPNEPLDDTGGARKKTFTSNVSGIFYPRRKAACNNIASICVFLCTSDSITGPLGLLSLILND